MKMSEKLQEIKKDNKGFSLVELIIVIAIMAILIGIVGMNVIPQIENARKATDAQVLSAMVSEAMEAWTMVDNAATDATIKVDVNASTGAITLNSANPADGSKLAKKFNELAKLDGSRVLKSTDGKALGTITITCSKAAGVYMGTNGYITKFEGYEFESR